MSVRSMTAFAQRHQQHDWGNISWELRAVNQRYLDVHFKLPENWRSLEPALREALRKRLNRGKIEVGLRIAAAEGDGQKLQLDQALIQQLADAAGSINQSLNQQREINPLELLQWPGVIKQSDQDGEAQSKILLSLFEKAIEELIATREREGADMKALVDQRLDGIEKITAEMRSRMPEIIQAQRAKLQARLDELKVELDPERLEAEIVLLAQKADVDEELDRLDTHVNETRRVLKKGGPCGRRLDFLMQELNREANTLSSKAIVTDSTQAAVELKVLIEQMREQIQNIE